MSKKCECGFCVECTQDYPNNTKGEKMTDYRCDHGQYSAGRDCPECRKEESMRAWAINKQKEQGVEDISEELLQAALPLMRYLTTKNPHTICIVTSIHAELMSGELTAHSGDSALCDK